MANSEAQISPQLLRKLCFNPTKSTDTTHPADTTAPSWSDFWVFDNPSYQDWTSEPYHSSTAILCVAYHDEKVIKRTSQLISQDLKYAGASVFTFMFEAGSVAKNSSAFSRALLHKLASMCSTQHRNALLHRFLEALGNKVRPEWTAKTPQYKIVDELRENLFKSDGQYMIEALELALRECVLECSEPFVVLIYGLESITSDYQQLTSFRACLDRIINILRNPVLHHIQCKVVFTDRSSALFGDSTEIRLLDYSTLPEG